MNLAHYILEKILPAGFKGYLNQKFPDWPFFVHKGEIRTKVWLNKLASEIIKIVLLAVVVCVAYIAGLYFLRGSWHLFADTMIGSQYINNVDVVRAAEISRVLSIEFKKLGLTIILLTVLVSGVVGIISQVTMLRRFFYVGRSLLVKLGWVVLVAGVVADQLTGYYQIKFYLSFCLVFLPTMIIFSSVLVTVGKLLPELNLLMFLANYRERKEIQNLKDDLAQLQNEGPGE